MTTYPVIFTIGLCLVTIILYIKGKLYVAPIEEEHQSPKNPDLKVIESNTEILAKQANEKYSGHQSKERRNIERDKSVSAKKKHLKAV